MTNVGEVHDKQFWPPWNCCDPRPHLSLALSAAHLQLSVPNSSVIVMHADAQSTASSSHPSPRTNSYLIKTAIIRRRSEAVSHEPKVNVRYTYVDTPKPKSWSGKGTVIQPAVIRRRVESVSQDPTISSRPTSMDSYKSKAKSKSSVASLANSKKRSRIKVKSESNAREATVRSLDHLGLEAAPLPSAAKPPVSKKLYGRGKRKVSKKKIEEDDAGASSGDEYAGNLLDTYIGQIGACRALGMKANDVLNMDAWNALSEEERDFLRVYLPQSFSLKEKDDTVRRLLNGDSVYFGSPRDRIFDAVAAGCTHPRVKRWRLRVTLLERRHHLLTLREFHNRNIRRLLGRKACIEVQQDSLAGLAAVGGHLTKMGGALQALPGRIYATAEAAAQSNVNEWNADRWRRVLDFRNQETQRYKVPERAFRYENPWGPSIVGPLKRGPALDGGRPREHGLLRNERPSHVTILCIVRDAASRLPDNRGTRADICDLLRDSQYLKEGATFQQLNTVVSGALDRLHYEENAPVRYDAESKEWCYLHNNMDIDDFERPAWARENPGKSESALLNSTRNSTSAVVRSKPKKKKRKKMAQ